MSEYRKTSPDDLYFFTLTVVGWIDVFTRNEYKDILVENLTHCQQKEGLEIFAYVIMTNHLHMIARRRDKDLSELLGRFKSYTAKKIIEAIDKNEKESRKDWLKYLFGFFAKQNNDGFKLDPGKYIVYVVDGNGCVSPKDSVEVLKPSGPTTLNMCFRWKTRVEEQRDFTPPIQTSNAATIASTNTKQSLQNRC